ncbi:MAG: hypothetical protein ACM3US_16545 [Sphingomonadaceae bacterium]
MDTIREAVGVAVMVAIQMGMPVTILFLIGYRRHQSDKKVQILCGEHPATVGPKDSGQSRRLTPGVPDRCWEFKACSPERRASCPSSGHPELRCWQAMKLERGRLQADCLDCERFLAPPRSMQP